MAMRRILAVLPLIWPAGAVAHEGHPEAGGSELLLGLAHPLGGADHLLAMVAVGMWAAMLGGRAVWAVPAAFVAGMGVGGAAGFAGVVLPGAEAAILASLVLFGAALAVARQVPLAAAFAAAVVFGLAHGTAHGLEAPAGGGLGYGAGFLIATAALHAAGVLAARWFFRGGTRLIGAGTAVAGIVLAVAP